MRKCFNKLSILEEEQSTTTSWSADAIRGSRISGGRTFRELAYTRMLVLQKTDLPPRCTLVSNHFEAEMCQEGVTMIADCGELTWEAMMELIRNVERYCLVVCSSDNVFLRVLGKSKVLIYPHRRRRYTLGNCGALIESAVINRQTPVTA